MCGNCNQIGHPASFKGCPFIKFTTNLKKQESVTNKTRENTRRNTFRSFVAKHNPRANNFPVNNVRPLQANFHKSQKDSRIAAQHELPNHWLQNNRNNSKYLFSENNDRTPNNEFIDLLNTIKQQIIESINMQLSQFQYHSANNSRKINKLYDAFEINDG